MEVRIREEQQRKIIQSLQKENVTEPVNEGIRNIVMWLQAHIMKSEPVVTGRLRSSITPKLDQQAFTGKVDTNVEYAPFVEYGHASRSGSFVPPSRVQHGTSLRIRDVGAFTYAEREANTKIKGWLDAIGSKIQRRFMGWD